jgi:hypothetical protein
MTHAASDAPFYDFETNWNWNFDSIEWIELVVIIIIIFIVDDLRIWDKDVGHGEDECT